MSMSAGDRLRLGVVPYLNACPLIDGLAGRADVDLVRVRPSALGDLLTADEVQAALVPGVDYWRRREDWRVAAPYGIVSYGSVWTVKVFSDVPFSEITRLYVDADSHSSLALADVILREWYGRNVALVCRDFTPQEGDDRSASWLLIGDKALAGVDRRHAYDLGQLWHEHTGLPFVFALWVMSGTKHLDRLGGLLRETAERNLGRIDQLAAEHGRRHGFETAAAREYLGQVIRYRIGPREREGLAHFGRLLAKHGRGAACPQRV